MLNGSINKKKMYDGVVGDDFFSNQDPQLDLDEPNTKYQATEDTV